MITLISGTNRPGSRTKKVTDFYAGLLKSKGVEANIIDLTELPENFPALVFRRQEQTEKVAHIQHLIDRSTAVVFVVPEYNGSFPGALKTFIDLLRYPDSFKGKTGVLVGLGSGMQGSILALSHLTDILHYMGMHVLPQKVRLATIDRYLVNGQITEPLYLQLLDEQIEALLKD
jgi:NAD(P)H-dependent FMN reductase